MKEYKWWLKFSNSILFEGSLSKQDCWYVSPTLHVCNMSVTYLLNVCNISVTCLHHFYFKGIGLSTMHVSLLLLLLFLLLLPPVCLSHWANGVVDMSLQHFKRICLLSLCKDKATRFETKPYKVLWLPPYAIRGFCNCHYAPGPRHNLR